MMLSLDDQDAFVALATIGANADHLSILFGIQVPTVRRLAKKLKVRIHENEKRSRS